MQLTPGSRLYNALLLNARFALSLDVDRLLYSFRTVAGVDTRGAQPYGGWESPDYVCHGALRGPRAHGLRVAQPTAGGH